jgi:hypothetical protein
MDAIQRLVVADDVFIIVALPDGSTGHATQGVDAFGGGGFKTGDIITNATQAPAAVPAGATGQSPRQVFTRYNTNYWMLHSPYYHYFFSFSVPKVSCEHFHGLKEIAFSILLITKLIVINWSSAS